MAGPIYTSVRPNPWSSVFDPLVGARTQERFRGQERAFQSAERSKERDFLREQSDRSMLMNFATDMHKSILAGDVPVQLQERSLDMVFKIVGELRNNPLTEAEMASLATGDKMPNSFVKEAAREQLKAETEATKAGTIATQRKTPTEEQAGRLIEGDIRGQEAQAELLEEKSKTLRWDRSPAGKAPVSYTKMLRELEAKEGMQFRQETGMSIEQFLNIALADDFDPSKAGADGGLMSAAEVSRWNDLIDRYNLPVQPIIMTDKGLWRVSDTFPESAPLRSPLKAETTVETLAEKIRARHGTR